MHGRVSVCTNYVHGYVSKTTILRVSLLADSDTTYHPLHPRPPPPCVPRRRNPSPPRFLFGRNRAAAKSGYSGGPAAMSFINVLAKWPVRPSHPLSTVIKVGHTWPPRGGGNILDRLMEWFSKWKDTVYFRNVVGRGICIFCPLSFSLSRRLLTDCYTCKIIWKYSMELKSCFRDN